MDATKSAQIKPSDLKYQGRKASRANSEQRRRCILEAALRIVVREGVRGVRHRAVAKEAEVPLSATTYYFKDISDLITDAFTLFVEMGAKKFNAFWEESDSRLQEALGSLDGSIQSKQLFAENMTELALSYVQFQLREHRDYLIVERSFQLECLRNENLKPVAFRHQRYLLDSLEHFFGRLGSNEAQVDARLFIAVIMQAEYEALVIGEDNCAAMIKAMLSRQIKVMLKVS